jgi:phage-related protein
MPKTWEQVINQFKNNAMQAFDPLLKKISDLANHPGMQGFLDRFTDIVGFIGEIIGNVFGYVADMLMKAGPFVDRILEPIKGILNTVAEAVMQVIKYFDELFTQDTEFIDSLVKGFTAFKSIVEKVMPFVVETIKVLLGFLKKVLETIVDVVT